MMNRDENDECTLECLKIHGYIFSSESQTDEDDSRCELDKRYEKYKPPMFKIDPAKYNLIIIDQSDEETKFADEKSVKNKKLHSKVFKESSSRDIATQINVNSDEVLTLASNSHQNWTKVPKRRKRRSKKHGLISPNEVAVVNDGYKLLNLVSDNDITENEERYLLCDFKTTSDDGSASIKINELRKTCGYCEINEVTLEKVCCDKKSCESHQPYSSNENLPCLEDVVDVKPPTDHDDPSKVKRKKSRKKAKIQGNKSGQGSFECNERTCEVINPTLPVGLVKKRKRTKRRNKKNRQISEESCELHMSNDFSRDINTRNQKIEYFTYFTTAENSGGSELVDVSLLRKMPSVEVLSLSINKINSLVDFQFCKRLEELYIRQNDIRDINEVVHLQNLPNLKNLWLGENPCANVDGYRLAVIKALPQLQKLDNVQVTQEDLKEAQRKGRTLTHPDDAQESEEEEYAPQQQQQYNRYQEYSESEYSPVQRSPPRQEQSPPRRAEPVRKSYSPEPVYVERRRNSYERESPKQQAQYYDRCPAADHTYEDNTHHCDNNYREVKIVNSQSANCIKEYTNGDRYVQSQPQYRQNEVSDVSSAHSHERRERYTCPAAHNRPPFARRPVTRNSNILSAVLRLVKELDYPSLEVVEMEVRSRMDELDE